MQTLAFDPDEELPEDELDWIAVTWGKNRFEIMKPTPGQAMLLMDKMGGNVSARVNGIMSFFRNVSPELAALVEEYLANPRVPNAEEKVIDFFYDLMETATGNPSSSATGSSGSRSSGGQSSTGAARRPASTRSTSRSRGSSTSSSGGTARR